VGVGKTRELFMLNEKLTAQEALAAGIFHRVAPDAELKTMTGEIAARLARTPSLGWALMKDSLNKAEHLEITEALENEQNNMSRASAARAEGRRAKGG
jgi:2-(1,2-epoxy-1,2-dihydrophenyl)acetyl-CoA isomerase